MSIVRRIAWSVVGLGVLVGAAACGNELGERTSPDPSASRSGVAVSEGWLAVIAVAADPDDLDPLTDELLPVGGVAFVVSPAECFEGLPAAHADAGYVLGFLSEVRADVDALVERSGRPALFLAQVRSRCTD